MTCIDKALSRLEKHEQEAVRKFWRMENIVRAEERELRRRNVLVRR